MSIVWQPQLSGHADVELPDLIVPRPLLSTHVVGCQHLLEAKPGEQAANFSLFQVETKSAEPGHVIAVSGFTG